MQGEKAHSELAASAAERWLSCPGSVRLCRTVPPSPPNRWSIEGTEAHAVMETWLKTGKEPKDAPSEMRYHVSKMVYFVQDELEKGGDLFVETKIKLPEDIGPDMFGTVDAAIVEPCGTLHIIDLKYGVSPVSPERNLQLSYYALGFAERFKYLFDRIKLTVSQPRITSSFPNRTWETLPRYLEQTKKLFQAGVKRTQYPNAPLNEGKFCYWCPAREVCPLKSEKNLQRTRELFE